MNYQFNEAIDILERTPATLRSLLSGLSDEWIKCNEGESTWSPFDIVGHLIEGEKFLWIPRLEMILTIGENEPFSPFDRFSQLQINTAKTMEELLEEFSIRRQTSLEKLTELIQPDLNLDQTGFHPEFGTVKLRELLATWTAHDLSHTAQIIRVMAKRYKEDVGPWKVNLRVLKS